MGVKQTSNAMLHIHHAKIRRASVLTEWQTSTPNKSSSAPKRYDIANANSPEPIWRTRDVSIRPRLRRRRYAAHAIAGKLHSATTRTVNWPSNGGRNRGAPGPTVTKSAKAVMCQIRLITATAPTAYTHPSRIQRRIRPRVFILRLRKCEHVRIGRTPPKTSLDREILHSS
jgi:hypothetical protein